MIQALPGKLRRRPRVVQRPLVDVDDNHLPGPDPKIVPGVPVGKLFSRVNCSGYNKINGAETDPIKRSEGL